MGLNHTGELLVRMQALPFEAVFPTSEKGASAAFGAVIPELPEGLLQNIGGVQAPVGWSNFLSARRPSRLRFSRRESKV